MNCTRARARLTAGDGAAPDVRAHVAGCPACAAFSRRVEAVRAGLREHRVAVDPDPGFAARVVAALPRSPAEDLGRAALRLLPAAALLAVALGAFAVWHGAPTDTSEPSAPTDDVLAWVLDGGDSAP